MPAKNAAAVVSTGVEVEVIIRRDGKAETFKLEVQPPVSGKAQYMHAIPASGSKAIAPFSKLYIAK